MLMKSFAKCFHKVWETTNYNQFLLKLTQLLLFKILWFFLFSDNIGQYSDNVDETQLAFYPIRS